TRVQESDKAGGGADLPEDGAHGEGTEPPAADPAPGPVRPPAGSQAEQDAIFKALVAAFDDPVDLRTWPESEDLSDDDRDRNRLSGLADLTPQPRPRPETGPRDWDAPDDPDDDH